MALAGRDSKVHWSVKESTLRSIFTPAGEALITTLKAPWRSLFSFLCVCLPWHSLHVITQISFKWISVCFHHNSAQNIWWNIVVTSVYSMHLNQRALICIWETEISRFNEMLFMARGCSGGYEALLMMIHFMPYLFITLGLACVLKPDSCWAALLQVYTLFSLLYQFNYLQPSVNLTFSNQKPYSDTGLIW